MTVHSNPMLRRLELPALASTTGIIWLQSNPAFDNCGYYRSLKPYSNCSIEDPPCP